MQVQGLPGFRDFFPRSLPSGRTSSRRWRRVAPPLRVRGVRRAAARAARALHRKSGEEIVGQLYSFTDKGGREVALRPEMTPTLARMVAARANGLEEADPLVLDSPAVPLRAAAAGPAARALPAQLRPDRRAGPAGDAEIIALAHRRDARARARPRRTCGCGSPTGGCSRVLLRGDRDRRRRQTARVSARSTSWAGRSTRTPEARARRGRRREEADRRGWSALPAIRTWADLEASFPARRRGAGEPLRAHLGRRSTRWDWATSSTSISRSCAGWRTTPARCSSCSTHGQSCAPSAAADATTICSRAGRGGSPRARIRDGRRGARRAAARSGGSLPTAPTSAGRVRGGGHEEDRAARARAGARSCGTGAPRSSTRSATQALASSSSWPRRGGARFAVVLGPDDRARRRGGQGSRRELPARAAERAVECRGDSGVAAAMADRASIERMMDRWQRQGTDHRGPRTSAAWYNEVDHEGRAGRLQPGPRLHGHPPQRLRHLGADAARAGPACSRTPATRTPTSRCSFPRASSSKEAEHVEGFAPETRGGHPRRRQGAGGAAGRPAHLRDDHLRDVLEVDPELSRPARC